jgi:hypothetical protein
MATFLSTQRRQGLKRVWMIDAQHPVPCHAFINDSTAMCWSRAAPRFRAASRNDIKQRWPCMVSNHNVQEVLDVTRHRYTTAIERLAEADMAEESFNATMNAQPSGNLVLMKRAATSSATRRMKRRNPERLFGEFGDEFGFGLKFTT